MLTRLYIKNFALVREMTLEFSPKMNVLTGETGAGKSILIDALRFVLGERWESEKLRSTDESCVVEAAFELKQGTHTKGSSCVSPVLSELEPFLEAGEELLILRREQLANGKARAFVNNRMTSVASLRQIGARLLDIHGQYDHQLLLDAASHLDLIDRLAQNDPLLEKYQMLFAEYELLEKRLAELRALESGRERELDLLKYQIEEIERAKLESADEEEELEKERMKLASSEKIHEKLAHLLEVLEEGDAAASTLLSQAAKDLTDLVRIDGALEATKNEFEDSRIRIEEAIRSLRNYRDDFAFDPDRLQEIEERLDILQHLKKKYGGSLSKALEFFAEAKQKYDQLVNSEVYGREIESEKKKILPKLEALADELSQKRRKAVASLKRTIETELKDLAIPNARFDYSMESGAFLITGKDRLEFLISLNAGEAPLPLRKIISAGEVSRVMLAMKKALMKVDPVSTLIFDEIDSNIGGRLGTVTGEKLKEIAAERQVLLITHLPQIASFADRHIKVQKVVRQGKTFAEYKLVEGEERVRELAQMMSGQNETEISKKHAKEMLSRVR